jgi:thiamine biosynthesis protein ThiS
VALEGGDELSERSEFSSSPWKLRRGPSTNHRPKVVMQVTINGKPTKAMAGSTIQNLLDRLQLDSRQVVVERNRDIVPRQRFSEELLAEGDTLEIVHFVGGG